MMSPEEFQDQNQFETMVNSKVFPWIKIVIRIFNRLDLRCQHKGRCSTFCYAKQTNSCRNLIDALTYLYRSSTDENHSHFVMMNNYLKKQVRTNDRTNERRKTFRVVLGHIVNFCSIDDSL